MGLLLAVSLVMLLEAAISSGEWPAKRRRRLGAAGGALACCAAARCQAGALLGTGLTPLAGCPDPPGPAAEDMLVWGWRIPFLLAFFSALLGGWQAGSGVRASGCRRLPLRLPPPRPALLLVTRTSFVLCPPARLPPRLLAAARHARTARLPGGRPQGAAALVPHVDPAPAVAGLQVGGARRRGACCGKGVSAGPRPRARGAHQEALSWRARTRASDMCPPARQGARRGRRQSGAGRRAKHHQPDQRCGRQRRHSPAGERRCQRGGGNV